MTARAPDRFPVRAGSAGSSLDGPFTEDAMLPRRSARGASAALLLPLLLAACGDDPAGPGATPLGCYAVTLGEWSAPREAVDPPGVVRLTGERGDDGMSEGRTLIAEADPADPLFYPWSWWENPEPDSLALVFTGGFVGVTAGLRWAGDDEWRGRATAFTDVAPGVEANASISLRPVACP
jgi:hypothetical protein